MAIISVSLPDGLVQDMDHAIEASGHKGRSALVRTALREHLARRPPATRAHIHGSITIVYPHGKEARISDVRHAFHDVVLSLMHTHCEVETCMDVLIVGGPAARIQDLHDTLSRTREVQRVRLVTVA